VAHLGTTTGAHTTVPKIFVDFQQREYHLSTRRLGKGAFGEVFLAMGADGAMAAVKLFCIDDAVSPPSMDWAPFGVSRGPQSQAQSQGASASLSNWTIGSAASAPCAGGLTAFAGLRGDTFGGPPLRRRSSAAPVTRSIVVKGVQAYGRTCVDITSWDAGTPGAAGTLHSVPRECGEVDMELSPTGAARGAQCSAMHTSDTVRTSGADHASAPVRASARQGRLEQIVNEVKMMTSMRHDNIVQYLGCAVPAPFVHALICMEYISGGSLHALLETFSGELPVSSVQRYVTDIVRGLEFIHASNIIHQDLKLGEQHTSKQAQLFSCTIQTAHICSCSCSFCTTICACACSRTRTRASTREL
jgi:serine/threonine protein kinase